MKEQREIRVGDPELKAIAAIQRALAGLDTQAVGRVLTFCIDRARQDLERHRTVPDPYTPPGNVMTNAALEPVQTGA